MSRTKDWDIYHAAPTYQRWWVDQGTIANPQAGYWTTRTVNFSPIIGDHGKRSYLTTPNFFARGRNWTAPLAFDADFYQQHWEDYSRQSDTTIRTNSFGQPVLCYLNDSTDLTENSSGYFQFLPDTTSDFNSPLTWRLGDKVTNRNLDKMKDSSINVAVAYAEREETVKTVTNTIKTVSRVLHNLHSGNFGGAAKALGIKPPKRARRRFEKAYSESSTANDIANAVTGGWLGLQYGWKPLLQDVHGMAEQLAKVNLRGENCNTVRCAVSSRASQTFRDVKTTKYPQYAPWLGTDEYTQSATQTQTIYQKIWYEVSSPLVHDLSSLGITNPALVAWELVPYSFVVDWFLPIGNWLGNLDATNGLSFKGGFTTYHAKYDALSTITTLLYDKSRVDSVRIRLGSGFLRKRKVKRVPLTGYPPNPFPRFKNPLSYSHLTSALSLLKQFKR